MMSRFSLFRPTTTDIRRLRRRCLANKARLNYERLEARCMLAVLFSHAGDPLRTLVPSQHDYDEIGLDWTGAIEPFDETAWASVTGTPNGVGYDRGDGSYAPFIGEDIETTMWNSSPTFFVRAEFHASNLSEVNALRLDLRFDDGFIAWINGVEVARSGISGLYPSWDAPANESQEATAASPETIDLTDQLGLLNDGRNVLAIRAFNVSTGDDDALIQFSLIGESLEGPPIANPDTADTLEDTAVLIDVLANDQSRSDPIDPATVEIVSPPSQGSVTVLPSGMIRYTPAPDYHGAETFSYRVHDTTFGPAVNTTLVATNSSVRYHVPANESLGTTWRGADFDDMAWLGGTLGLGYDDNPSVDFSPHIATNVRPLMYDVNSTIYMRSTFTLADSAEVSSLTLRIRCDDGFAAFLNGTPVASIYAPSDLAYDTSTNGANGGDASALSFRTFDLTPYLASLRAGPNVLAIHGLNQFTTSSDLLMQPELTAMVSWPGRLSNPATVNVQVASAPDAPRTTNDFYEINEGSTLVVSPGGSIPSVLVNDRDPDGDPISASVVAMPSHGTLLFAPDGYFIYSPNANFAGVDSFAYLATDGILSSSTSTVQIEVRHLPPTAHNDEFSVNRNATLTVNTASGVLSNDFDTQGHALQAELVSPPAVGTLTLHASGSFNYVPPSGFAGEVVFTYRATDGVSVSNTATATIRVKLPPPLTTADSYAVAAGLPFETPVAFADRPGPGKGLKIVAGFGREIMRFDAYTNEPLGTILTLSRFPDGNTRFDFAPDGRLFVSYFGENLFSIFDGATGVPLGQLDSQLSSIRDFEFGPDGMLYVADFNVRAILRYDPVSGAALGRFDAGRTLSSPYDLAFGPDGHLYVSDVGQHVVARFDGNTGVFIDDFIQPTFRKNPLHIAFGHDGLAYVGWSQPTQINRYAPDTGALVGTPFSTLNPGALLYGADDALYSAARSYEFISRYSTATGAELSRISYNSEDPIHGLAFDPTTLLTAGVLNNDQRRPGTTVELVSGTTHGTLELRPDGTFAYDPNLGYLGTDSFVYRAMHDGVYSDDSLVTLTVAHGVVSNNEAFATDEDLPLVVPAAGGLLANDIDSEGLPLTPSLLVPPVHGVVDIAADGAFVYTPNAHFHGEDEFTYRVTNGTDISVPARVTIQINSVPDAPVTTIDSYEVVENARLTAASVLANDLEPDGDSMTAVLVTPTANGTLTFSPNGTFTYRGRSDFSGTDQFTYYATDGTRQSAPTIVQINVVHGRPLGRADSYTLVEDTVLEIDAPQGVLANDFDSVGHALVAILEEHPTDGEIVLRQDGGFRYTPPRNFSGTATFVYRASDGIRQSVDTTVTFSVTGLNDAPVTMPDTYSTSKDVPIVVGRVGVPASAAAFEAPIEIAAFPMPANVFDVQYSSLYDLVIVRTSQAILTYDAKTGVQLDERRPVSSFNRISLTPDGRFLFTSDYSPSTSSPDVVHRFDLGNRTWETRTTTEVAFWVLALDKNRVLFQRDSGFETTLNRWDDNPGSTSLTRLARYTSFDHEALLYDSRTQNVLGIASGIRSAKFDGDRLVFGPPDVHHNDAGPLALSADGQRVYAGASQIDATSPFRRWRAFPERIMAESAKFAFAARNVYNAITGVLLGQLPFTASQYFVTTDEKHVWAFEPGANRLHHLTFPDFGVLANDNEVERDAMTAVLAAPPEHGTVALAPDGTFTYTPEANFVGFDRFIYRATDGAAASEPVEVVIAVGTTGEIGDVNRDNTIDLRDVASVVGAIGSAVGIDVHQTADVNGDGIITFSDAIEVRNRISELPAPSAAAAVRVFEQRISPQAADHVFAEPTRRRAKARIADLDPVVENAKARQDAEVPLRAPRSSIQTRVRRITS
jgi:hypothetical protein